MSFQLVSQHAPHGLTILRSHHRCTVSQKINIRFTCEMIWSTSHCEQAAALQSNRDSCVDVTYDLIAPDITVFRSARYLVFEVTETGKLYSRPCPSDSRSMIMVATAR
jgi:hypothetical protein